jgi:hypothetical protein
MSLGAMRPHPTCSKASHTNGLVKVVKVVQLVFVERREVEDTILILIGTRYCAQDDISDSAVHFRGGKNHNDSEKRKDEMSEIGYNGTANDS